MTDDLTASLSDEARGLQFHYPSGTAPGDSELLIQSFEGEDRLGRLFEYRLDLLCDTMDVDFDKIVGKNVAVSIEHEGGKRYFNGYITDFTFRGSEGRFGRFSATLRPWLWFLSRTSNCRIFQEKTVPDIIEEVFRDRGLTHFEKKGLSATYQKRDYCVQYRESDLDFVSRLMELEGIYYFFEHEADKHTMVLVDSPSSHEANPSYEEVLYYPATDNDARRSVDHLQDWMLRQTIIPTEFSQRDYDFTKPKTDLTTKSKLVNPQEHDNPLSDPEIFDYPGDFKESGDGRHNSDVLADTWETQGLKAFSNGNVRGMVAGCTFELTDYPHEPQNQEYLVVSVHHQIYGDEAVSGSGGDREFYRCHIEAVKKDWPYRSQRITPKPMIRGPQTARVVGTEGEEIYCDEYGRVKVRFHWDRDDEKKDQNSTCWIRVSQLWAGKGWGGMHIPRIGQEVVVSFLEGDPDQPLITGSVYNAEHMPAYELPEHQTRSGIQSRSTKEGQEDNFNELRFEDKKDEEEVYFQSEKDLNTWIKNKETRKIGATRTSEIGNPEHEGTDRPGISDDAETLTVHGSKKTEIKGNEVYEVATDAMASKGRDVTIKNGDDKLVVAMGNLIEEVTMGNVTKEVKMGNVTQKVSMGNFTQELMLGNISRSTAVGKVTEQALQGIELTVGPSSIKIAPHGITIEGPMVTINGMALTKITGGMVMIN